MCCMKGKVVLPLLKNPPQELIDLLCKGDKLSKHFREFIRAYNMMFSFTSLGGKIIHSVNNGHGPYVFQMNGENYHRIGDIIPKEGESPKFSQLYIYDTKNEIANRIKAYGSTGKGTENLDEKIVGMLKKMLDTCNKHVEGFRMARDRFDVNNITGMKLRLVEDRFNDPRTHNIPTADEVAALIVGDFKQNMKTRDIILETNTGSLKRISELHPAYLALQYPLLFPYGEDGYRLGIPIGFEDTNGRQRKTISLREFLAFRFQEREGEAPTITRSGRLYQQILVDSYTMMESSRLRYCYLNQKNLRSDNYEAIQKAAEKGGAKLTKQGIYPLQV